MKKIALALLISTSPLAAHATDPWTKTDTTLEAVVLAAFVVDWNQTIQIGQFYPLPICVTAAVPNGPSNTACRKSAFHEINPILGAHPNGARTTVYFMGCAALHATVAYLLPKPYRTIWQSIAIGVEADVVQTNYTAGFKIRF